MGRLFWKIFFWFWIALLLLNLGVGWGVKLYYGQLQENDDRLLQIKIATIAEAFEAGDNQKARELLRQSRGKDGTPIFVINDRGRDFLNRPLPHFIRKAIREGEVEHQKIQRVEARLPGGEQIQLIAVQRPSWLKSFRNTPVWIGLAITLVISTLVCYWLARYLSSPLQRLSHATRQLADGRLEVRIGEIRRRDEIADLAQDFDRMADKIQQLLGSQKQLLQDISHELRSPLARLQVALALASRSNDQQTTYYNRIGKDLDRLEELIGEVLTLSRIDTVTYTREPVDLTELVTNITDDCNLEASAKGCSVHNNTEMNLLLEGSPELLRRAIENVVRNAIKFTAAGSRIDITAKKNDHHIVIAVDDQGPGIPDTSKDSIFEAFVRIDEARPHKPGGYGLGLAIAKKAIEIHGGQIRAENRREGGLTVTITLPI